MKRLLQWMMAAILICGSTVFISCTNEDNPSNPADNLAEKLIGKWMMYTDIDGQQALTDNKEVITFVSSTKAYVSRSRGAMGDKPQDSEPQDSEAQAPEPQDLPDSNPGAAGWDDYVECDVTIEGNLVILTSDGPNGAKHSVKYLIQSISETEFSCDVTREAPGGAGGPGMPPEGDNGGDKKMDKKQDQRYKRVTRDYSEEILGLWECKGLKGGETYNDANGRLEFYEDGTYQYWRLTDEGEWEEVTTREFQEYFVDGGFLCTRWKNIDDPELREWWEIVTIKGDKMQWKALRQNEDGSTFKQTMDWERVVE